MMGIDSDPEMKAVIDTAEAALGGTTMADLKKSTMKRNDMNAAFKKVRESLGGLVTAAPTRAINVADLDD